MQIVLTQPRGFCAGVTRAIDIVERSLEMHGAPVYVFHEIVHHPWVVDDLRSKGAVFVNDLAEVPAEAVMVFAAHGVSRAVQTEAANRHLHTIDATCPLVSQVHQQAQRFVRQGHTLVMIGRAGDEEVEGTLGQVNATVHLVSEVADVHSLALPAHTPLAYVIQTTLSQDDTREIVEALKARFPRIVGPDGDAATCHAAQNRQIAVRRLATQVDLVLVVGDSNSIDALRLRDVAERSGVPAHLVQDEHGVQAEWLRGVPRVGVTAGASTPEPLVQRVVKALQTRASVAPLQIVHLAGARQDVTFRLPAEFSAAPLAIASHG